MTVWYAGAYALKHVENGNKHTWTTVRQVGYLQGSYQDSRSTKRKILYVVILHRSWIVNIYYKIRNTWTQDRPLWTTLKNRWQWWCWWYKLYHIRIGISLVRSQLVPLEFFIDIKSFRSRYGPGIDSASNINEYQEHLLGGKGGRCVRLTTLPASCAVVMKSGNFNFLEPSGQLQACNGTALPLPLHHIRPLFSKNYVSTFYNVSSI